MKDIPLWSPSNHDSESVITDGRQRAITVFLWSDVSCLLAGMITILCSSIISPCYGLIISAALFVLSILINYKKNAAHYYKIGIITNSVACGFSISAYYSYIKIEIGIESILEVSAAFTLLLLLSCILILHVNNRRILSIIIAVPLFLLVSGLIYLWIEKGTYILSLSFFISICLSCFCITGLVTIKSTRNIWKDIFWGSCGVVFLIILVILIIISEGEALGDVDFGGGENSNIAKTANKRTFHR